MMTTTIWIKNERAMKRIKIFLASSEELENDRNAFGNLIRRLNKSYGKRGISLDLFEWEDYDAAYNDRRKQEEYNDEVRSSDMFLALFHTKAGQFTIEEFEVATEEFLRRSLPKVYTYCKDLAAGEVESKELAEFKQRLINEMGHYWSRYSNRDTMQLHFVMQLQIVEGSLGESLKVENGEVSLDGLHIAKMENLPFAGRNEAFCKLSARLAELPERIAKAHSKVEKYPDDEDFRSEEQALIDEYNALKESFAEYQHNLFATAQRIARMQGERTTERMRRAMEAFNEGRVGEANTILDEAEHDARLALNALRESRKATEECRQNVIRSIEEILLKCQTTLSDLAIPVEERVRCTERLYVQADDMAREAEYDKAKYCQLLIAYKSFLNYYRLYNDKSLEINLRLCKMTEELYGTEHRDTAMSYHDVGEAYNRLGDYEKALKYLNMALSYFTKVEGEESLSVSYQYNSIGHTYFNMGDLDSALRHLLLATKIREKVAEQEPLADSYNNIGGLYVQMKEPSKALEYLHKALDIYHKILDKDNPDIGRTSLNIGTLHYKSENYDKAVEYYLQAAGVYEKAFGAENPTTANAYANVGVAYAKSGDAVRAVEYYQKALPTFRKHLGEEHKTTRTLITAIEEIHALFDKANE